MKRREVELDLQVSPEEIKRREVELDPQPRRVMNREVELGCGLFLNSCATNIVFVTLPSTAVETAIAQCTSRCAMARGHRLNTSIVLAAVQGLSGLFGENIRGQASTLSSSPHPPCP